MPNPNKVIIDNLINTVGQKDPKLFDALNKIASDLNKVYTTLFDGPLPAVDGHALTNLDATHLTGIIPRTNLPAEVAFIDVANIFIEDQTIEAAESSLKVGSDAATQFIRVGTEVDGSFYISQNFDYTGGSFTRDDTGAFGGILEIIDGEFIFSNWRPTTAEPTNGEYFHTFLLSGKELLVENFNENDQLSFLLLDDNDVFHLGESAASTGKGHVAIPNKLDTDVPTAASSLDGILMIDRVNHWLVYFTAGNRYKIAGVAF